MFSLKQFWLECWPTWKRTPLSAIWISCFNILIYSSFCFITAKRYAKSCLKASCRLKKFQTRKLTWLISPLEASDKEIQRPTSLVPIHSHTAGEMTWKWTLSPPKVPKVQHATRTRSPLGRRAPIPSVVLIKRTIMLLEMVVCLLVFPCYPYQSWSNMIYSCVCDVFYEHTFSCVYAEVRRRQAGLLDYSPHNFLKLSHWACSWPIQMNWLTGVPPGSSCPCIPSGEIKGTQCNAYLFKCIDLRSLVLCDEHFTDWVVFFHLCFLF